ncbi:NADP-dependent oxidoreductase [Dongia deserti]|uniref:NADP-dependent oxidoreductase n=1 Tax=Dongia deserti TaxID=2268030 RepID=UPI000E64C32E|nr:NADP-dependent oxidoreductase [Dongia deserti]
MAQLKSRRIVLASRPIGAPRSDNFRLLEEDIPDPRGGEVLLKTLWLSLDPYMRGRMSDAKSYAEPIGIGDVMPGGTVSKVLASRNKALAVGDIVLGYTGWQDYAVSDDTGLRKVDPTLAPISTALGVLGMPGMTAYTGLLNIGKPKAGETVVVAAASGAVGSIVGQIAKLKGCRVIGIAGGAGKVRYLTEELGFDVGLDHRSPNLTEQLQAAAPNGIDIYFENVGGHVWDAVFPLLNNFARVPVCGLIAHYNDTGPGPGPDRLPGMMNTILYKRLTVQGFIVLDFDSQTDAFLREVARWVREGKIKHREDIVTGLERAPAALAGLLEGRNFGKLLVKVAES